MVRTWNPSWQRDYVRNVMQAQISKIYLFIERQNKKEGDREMERGWEKGRENLTSAVSLHRSAQGSAPGQARPGPGASSRYSQWVT